MFVDPAYRQSPNTAPSGRSLAAANSRPANTSASARAAGKSGSRPATTRSSTSERQAVQSRQIRHRHHRPEAGDRQFRRPACGDQQGAGCDRVRSHRQGARRQREFSPTCSAIRWMKSVASTTACSSTPSIGRASNTVCSGRSSRAANTMRRNTSASARVARRSGSRPATTRSSISTASRSRSSNSPPTSPIRNWRRPISKASSRRSTRCRR